MTESWGSIAHCVYLVDPLEGNVVQGFFFPFIYYQSNLCKWTEDLLNCTSVNI